MSATSWTADEDFSILLSALDLYNSAAAAYASGKGGLKGSSGSLPKIVMIITGNGAGKAAFEREVLELEKRWDWVRVRTAWLALEDYPKLLGTLSSLLQFVSWLTFVLQVRLILASRCMRVPLVSTCR